MYIFGKSFSIVSKYNQRYGSTFLTRKSILSREYKSRFYSSVISD